MKDETVKDLRVRTKEFALRIIRLYTTLPKTTEAQVMGKQVLRSGTSVGAYYREASRAKSDADFVNKIEGALQELDETAYWLELLVESGIVKAEKLESLKLQAETLEPITRTSIVPAKRCGRKPIRPFS